MISLMGKNKQVITAVAVRELQVERKTLQISQRGHKLGASFIGRKDDV